jgi:hypothetical protein
MEVAFTPGSGVQVIDPGPEVSIKEAASLPGAKKPEKAKSGLNINPAAISQILMGLGTNPDEIEDEQLAADYRLLLWLVEELNQSNEKWKAEVQVLRDALNRLKGEQGQPNIKAGKKRKKGEGDISSEQERKSRKPPAEKKSKAKKHKIKIDRTEICEVDQSILPDDAQFKGHQSVIVQDIIIKTDNVEYRKEVYYSPAQKKTYIGELPPEVDGEFGPGVKSLVYTQKHVTTVSEPKIQEFLENGGIYISPATISRILTKNNELFHQEKADIFQAGLASTRYQQIDDTGARVKGENQYVQIVSNPYYAAYFTGPHKDRLSVLEILNGGQARSYLFNEEAFRLLAGFGLSKKLRGQLRASALDKEFDEEQMEALLKQIYPAPDRGKNNRLRIKEAGAIAAYHQRRDYPVIEVLLSDDAPQFKQLTPAQGLCWIHEGRHYKKLRPVVPWHQEKLAQFRGQYWDYYYQLVDYKENPSQQQADQLSTQFDQLFATETGYQALDERIAKTKAKKENLLMVLRYPELPLHNNGSELEARVQARKRDVSLHTMTEDGTKANDTFLTLVRTAKKLGVNPYEYIYDRVSKRFRLPSLADLIKEKCLHNEGFFDTS